MTTVTDEWILYSHVRPQVGDSVWIYDYAGGVQSGVYTPDNHPNYHNKFLVVNSRWVFGATYWQPMGINKPDIPVNIVVLDKFKRIFKVGQTVLKTETRGGIYVRKVVDIRNGKLYLNGAGGQHIRQPHELIILPDDWDKGD